MSEILVKHISRCVWVVLGGVTLEHFFWCPSLALYLCFASWSPWAKLFHFARLICHDGCALQTAHHGLDSQMWAKIKLSPLNYRCQVFFFSNICSWYLIIPFILMINVGNLCTFVALSALGVRYFTRNQKQYNLFVYTIYVHIIYQWCHLCNIPGN